MTTEVRTPEPKTRDRKSASTLLETKIYVAINGVLEVKTVGCPKASFSTISLAFCIADRTFL
jgi:hypothetical protein